MPDYGFIDIHTHTYPEARIAIQAMGGTARAGFTGTIAELIPFMEQQGIARAVQQNFTPVWDMAQAARRRFPADQTAEQRAEAEEALRQELARRIAQRNEWTCASAAAHPDRLVAFIGVDPLQGPEAMAADVETCFRQGARGIKLHPAVNHVPINDRGLWSAFETAQRLGMGILTHTGPFRGEGEEFAHPAMALDVLRDFPRLKVILAHCGGGFDREALDVIREFPDVWFDCCGVAPGGDEGSSRGYTDDEVVALFRKLGTERVIFGSDWCFRDPLPDVRRIEGLALTADEQRAVLLGNAERFLAE